MNAACIRTIEGSVIAGPSPHLGQRHLVDTAESQVLAYADGYDPLSSSGRKWGGMAKMKPERNPGLRV